MALSMRELSLLGQELESDKDNSNEKFEALKNNSFRVASEGDYVLRILPDKLEDKMWFRKIAVHYNLPERAHTCPKKTCVDYEIVELKDGKKVLKPIYLSDYCPICDYISELYETENSDDRQTAYDIRAVDRYIFNVIVYSHPPIHYKGDPVTYDPELAYVFNTAPKSIKEGFKGAGGLNEIENSKWEEGGDWGYVFPVLFDWDEGFKIKLSRAAKDGFTNYTVKPIEGREKRYVSDPKNKEEWTDRLFSLSDWVSNIIDSSNDELEEQVRLLRGNDPFALNEEIVVDDDDDEVTTSEPVLNEKEIEEALLEDYDDVEIDDDIDLDDLIDSME